MGKPIGHALKDVFKEGRKYEALSAGNEQLQRLDTKQRDIHTVSYVRKCGNCCACHKPRQCPAYKDTCSACNSIGHWKACCRKTRTKQRPRNSSGKRQESFPAAKVDMANQRTDVHQVTTERRIVYIQSILNTRRMASHTKNRSTPSLSALNVLTPLTTGPHHGMKHSRCSTYNHPDSRETFTHFGRR